MFHGEFYRGPGVKSRRIKERHGTILLLHQQKNFRAAQDDALHASRNQMIDDLYQLYFCFLFNQALAKLVINDFVDKASLFVVRNQDSNSIFTLQPAFVEILFHRKFASQKPHVHDSPGSDSLACNFADVDQGNLDFRLDGVCRFVH